MAALSDDGSICGKVLEELRSQFPNYKWKSKLHSNVIRGFTNDYNIMIVYFRMSKKFEVCIRGIDINCLIQGKNAVTALGELKEKMYEKKREIEKVIKDLTKEKLEDK